MAAIGVIFALVACGSTSLPLLNSEEQYASATSAAPLLFLFFFRSTGGEIGHRDGGGGELDGGGELVGGATTAALLADVRTLASRFEGSVAAVDCARVPRVCERRRIVETPTFKLYRSGSRSRYSHYAGALDLASLDAFMRRRLLAAMRAMEAEAASAAAAQSPSAAAAHAAAAPARDAAQTTWDASAARPLDDADVAGWARWAIGLARDVRAGRALADAHGVMLLGGAAWTTLCALVASFCALRLRGARARLGARLRARSVEFDGGRGVLTRGPRAGEETADLPAIVLVGPAAPSDRAAQHAQRAALDALAARLGTAGFRVLALDLEPSALLGERIAALVAAAQWLRDEGAARVGALGVGEGGALVSRAARLAACPLDCCLAFELGAADARLGADARGGVQQPALAQLAAALAELGALCAGARTAVQVHIDLLHGPLSADRPPTSAAEGRQREADTRAYAAAKLHAAAAKLRPSPAARAPGASPLFVYGLCAPGAGADGLAECLDELEDDDDADVPERDETAAELEPQPLLLQPDGAREVAKGYAWKRALSFLHSHLTR